MNSSEFTLQDSVVFDVGFESRFNYQGITRDKSTGEQLVYFGDPVTAKKIKLFNLNGGLEATIPLAEVEKELGTEMQMMMISPDTIILYGNNRCRFLCINRKGELWHITDLKEIKDSKGRIYDTGLPIISSSINNLYFTCFIAVDGFPDKPDSIQSHFDSYKYYHNQNFYAPMMYKIDGFFNLQPSIHFCMGDYAPKAYNKVYTSVNIASKIKILNNTIVAHCCYDDKLIFGNTKTFQTDTFFVANSSYTKQQSPERALNSFATEPELIEYIDNQQQKIFKTGGVLDFVFDKSKDKYYVFILHRNENSPNYFVREVNFSVISYDKRLNRLREYFFNKKKYSVIESTPLMTDKGLLVAKNTKSNDKKMYYYIKFSN